MASHALVPAAATTRGMKPTQQAMTKRERPVFSLSDDHAMSKKILDTHNPDGREVDVNVILHIVEDVFQHSYPAAMDGVLNVTFFIYDLVSCQYNKLKFCWLCLGIYVAANN